MDYFLLPVEKLMKTRNRNTRRLWHGLVEAEEDLKNPHCLGGKKVRIAFLPSKVLADPVELLDFEYCLWRQLYFLFA